MLVPQHLRVAHSTGSNVWDELPCHMIDVCDDVSFYTSPDTRPQMRPGPRFNIKMVSSYLTSVWATPMLKERWPVGHLFFGMVLPILVRQCLYIETGPGAAPTSWQFTGRFSNHVTSRNGVMRQHTRICHQQMRESG